MSPPPPPPPKKWVPVPIITPDTKITERLFNVILHLSSDRLFNVILHLSSDKNTVEFSLIEPIPNFDGT